MTTDIAVDFRASGNAASALVSGWSTPEREETWSCGKQSRLSLPAPTAPATYVLVLRCRPQVAQGRLESQRLGVTVNGRAVDNFVVSRDSVRACLLPWNLLQGEQSLDIVFTTPDSARPADLGSSKDRRRLGVAFSSLLLYPSQHAERPDGGAVDIGLIMAADQMPLNQLMLKFESLGQNCEFGLLQRQCQAEPLGLLRFSSTPLDQLLVALESRFEGMGAPGTIEVQISPNGREYMVKDTVFGFLYHAWVKTGEISPEEIVHREEKRVPFLVRKFLEDLDAGEKIFVFKGMGAMAEEAVFPLSAALRRHGPNTLLFVNLADDEKLAGTVEARAPGFLVGRVGRFAPTENAGDLALTQWVKVCREAYRLKLAKIC